MKMLIAPFCLLFLATGVASPQALSMDERIEKILTKGQSYDGEIFDGLVALGPEAVPYLAGRLYTLRLPKVILDAYAAFADKRATVPIIQFLHSRRDVWSTSDVLCQFAIKALKEINDPRAEPVLYELVSGSDIHFRIRFEATAALARLGSPQIKQWAWDRILEVYRTEPMNPNKGMENLTPREVYVGLCEVRSEEGIRLVSRLVANAGQGYIAMEMLGVLNRRPETKDSPELIASIRSLLSSTKETHEYPVKMAALKTLAIHDKTANKDDLMAQYLELETRYENQENPGIARSLKRVRDAIEGRDQ